MRSSRILGVESAARRSACVCFFGGSFRGGQPPGEETITGGFPFRTGPCTCLVDLPTAPPVGLPAVGRSSCFGRFVAARRGGRGSGSSADGCTTSDTSSIGGATASSGDGATSSSGRSASGMSASGNSMLTPSPSTAGGASSGASAIGGVTSGDSLVGVDCVSPGLLTGNTSSEERGATID